MSFKIPFDTCNLLLRMLDPSDLELIADHLELVTLVRRASIVKAGRQIRSVVFPEDAILSVVAIAQNDASVEIGIVGRDGASPCPILFGVEQVPYEVFVQGPGTGHRISAEALREICDRRSGLRDHLLKWEHAFSVQTAYTALANGVSTVEGRLARWLLMCHDRIDGDRIPITHEFLGVMLSVRRPSVSEAIDKLRDRGTIRTMRGMIWIVDRAVLMTVAGPAYGHPERQYERIFGIDLTNAKADDLKAA